MGLLKKIAGAGIAGAGVVTGQPQLVISGGSMVAGDIAAGEGKKKKPVTLQGRSGTIPGILPPPKVARSMVERRAMNRERMGRVYGVHGS